MSLRADICTAQINNTLTGKYC
ncbi:hypothetical protein PP590_gp31 [Pseudoalteromonas phage HS1]|nr:hypothetical protein PP589_gp39 [Pseudoalteromonas phage HS5]YP_010660188.1 hypothetical protein PP590_gp31 [Pseudoalteromonas phage HS1]